MKKIKFICLIFICFLMFTLVACETDVKNAPTNEKTDMIMEGEKVSSRLASFEYEDYVNYVKVNFTSNDLETGPLKPNPYENKDELSSNDIINLALEELRIDYNNLIQEVNDELNKKIVVLTYEALKLKVSNCSGTVNEVIQEIATYTNEFNNVILVLNKDIITVEELIENWLDKLTIAHDSAKVLIDVDTMEEIQPLYYNAKNVISEFTLNDYDKEKMYNVANEFISKAYSIIFEEIVTPFIPTIVFDDTYYINFKSEMESYIASFLLGYENCNGYMEVRNYCSNQIASTSYAITLEEFYELVSIAKANIYNALNNFVNQGAVIPEETVESLYAEFKNDITLYLDNFFPPYVNEKDYYEVRKYCENQVASTSVASTIEEFYELVNVAKTNIYNALNNFVNQGTVIPEETVESLYAEFKNDTMLYLDNFFAPYVNEKDYYEVRKYCENQVASTSVASTIEEFYELVNVAKANIYNALNNFINNLPVTSTTKDLTK